jgi:hypothetical protein
MRKIHLLCTHRVDNEDRDIPGVGTQAVNYRAGSRIFDGYKLDPNSPSERTPQLQRRSFDLARRRISCRCRQASNTKSGSQRAGLHEICHAGIRRMLSE